MSIVWSIETNRPGVLIGKQGATIKSMRSQSGCNIHISAVDARGYATVTLHGDFASVEVAAALIQAKLNNDARRQIVTGPNATENVSRQISTIYAGAVIGKAGATIQNIRSQTGCDIQITEADSLGKQTIMLFGSLQAVEDAHNLVHELLRQEELAFTMRRTTLASFVSAAHMSALVEQAPAVPSEPPPNTLANNLSSAEDDARLSHQAAGLSQARVQELCQKLAAARSSWEDKRTHALSAIATAKQAVGAAELDVAFHEEQLAAARSRLREIRGRLEEANKEIEMIEAEAIKNEAQLQEDLEQALHDKAILEKSHTQILTPQQVRQHASEGTEPTEDDDTCVICMAGSKTHLLVPCGHKCLCHACAFKLVLPSPCPLCRNMGMHVCKVWE
mmetsp:Transcript_64314/g.106897  ORF Transcript_64314/g.106897 Transcript_64314/m.106897 type:complete len:391 (+) Transcript_64314:113-1285(+)